MDNLIISEIEKEKITHDINNVWHVRYKEKKYCQIETHSNELNSKAYEYHFINYGFNEYLFVAKYPIIE